MESIKGRSAVRAHSMALKAKDYESKFQFEKAAKCHFAARNMFKKVMDELKGTERGSIAFEGFRLEDDLHYINEETIDSLKILENYHKNKAIQLKKMFKDEERNRLARQKKSASVSSSNSPHSPSPMSPSYSKGKEEPISSDKPNVVAHKSASTVSANSSTQKPKSRKHNLNFKRVSSRTVLASYNKLVQVGTDLKASLRASTSYPANPSQEEFLLVESEGLSSAEDSRLPREETDIMKENTELKKKINAYEDKIEKYLHQLDELKGAMAEFKNKWNESERVFTDSSSNNSTQSSQSKG
eukprot:snap_masked-scaffold_12-processed-gene-8.41-mRNA-1 protein AED:1.00 eAED:1.00 QI:0/-1/0/0/-1/1/1/0/298